jgi:hypothetical protein
MAPWRAPLTERRRRRSIMILIWRVRTLCNSPAEGDVQLDGVVEVHMWSGLLCCSPRRWSLVMEGLALEALGSFCVLMQCRRLGCCIISCSPSSQRCFLLYPGLRSPSLQLAEPCGGESGPGASLGLAAAGLGCHMPGLDFRNCASDVPSGRILSAWNAGLGQPERAN